MRQTVTKPSPAPLGKRMQRKVSTRQELLLAGRRLFSEEGLYESRVEDLTRIAGIAKGTLYLYFRDKEALILAVVTDGFQALRQQVRERTSGAHALSDVVTQLVAAHLEYFATNRDLHRIFHQARGMLKFDRPRWRPLRQPLVEHLECVAECLAQSPAVARLSPDERYDLAIELFGAVSGVTSVRVAMRPGEPVDTDPQELSLGLVATIRRRTAARSASGLRMRPQGARAPRQRQVVPGR
jgi:AcrR family transcriptional regulator